MKKIGSITFAFIIVIILVVVEIIIIKGASKYESQSDVVFAKVRISEKALITDEMLEVKKIDAGLAHRLSSATVKSIVGRKAKTDIEADEMILSAKLGHEDMERIEVKDKNKRLYSVEFKGDQANGWWLMVDQYVDIIFVPNIKSVQHFDDNYQNDEGYEPRNSLIPISGIINKLKGIRIAALIDENGKLLKNKNRSLLPRYISFEVTEEQAGFLAYAKSNGRLEVCVIPE